MAQLASVVWPLIESLPEIRAFIPELRSRLRENYKNLTFSILRNVFLIELVKIPKIETTKFRVRWFEQLNGDPRHCSFEECSKIATDLLRSLPIWLNTTAHSEALNLAFAYGLIPYEAPLDYKERA